MRITEHPVLPILESRKTVSFIHDGKPLSGYEGEPIAAAIRAAGISIHRYTKKYHTPRGVFCAIGRCTDCVMVVNGKPNIRVCVTPLQEGMIVETQYGAGGERNETL